MKRFFLVLSVLLVGTLGVAARQVIADLETAPYYLDLNGNGSSMTYAAANYYAHFTTASGSTDVLMTLVSGESDVYVAEGPAYEVCTSVWFFNAASESSTPYMYSSEYSVARTGADNMFVVSAAYEPMTNFMGEVSDPGTLDGSWSVYVAPVPETAPYYLDLNGNGSSMTYAAANYYAHFTTASGSTDVLMTLVSGESDVYVAEGPAYEVCTSVWFFNAASESSTPYMYSSEYSVARTGADNMFVVSAAYEPMTNFMGEVSDPGTLDGSWSVYVTTAKYILTVVADSTMGTVLGGGEYEEGSMVTIEAIPADGYEFLSWEDGITDNPRIILLESDTTLTALFSKIITLYTVTVLSANESMGTVLGGGEYEEGSMVTVEAIPADGYEFVEWSNGVTENPYSFTVKENVMLTASFQEIAQSVNLLEGENTSIKFIKDGKLYIVRNGILYDAQGHYIK